MFCLVSFHISHFSYFGFLTLPQATHTRPRFVCCGFMFHTFRDHWFSFVASGSSYIHTRPRFVWCGFIFHTLSDHWFSDIAAGSSYPATFCLLWFQIICFSGRFSFSALSPAPPFASQTACLTQTACTCSRWPRNILIKLWRF